MGTFRRFEDIEAWQEARILVTQIYRATASKKFARDFSLVDQIRRAAVSIPSNIAEGFGRGGDREFNNFLTIASGSLRELQNLLYISLDLGFLEDETCSALFMKSELISKKIGALMAYLKRSKIKGIRYK